MTRMRLTAALAALLALLLLAGCGGGEATATDAGGESAAVAPRAAAAWVAVDADADSAQWDALERLLQRIPGAEGAVDELFTDAFGQEGLDWATDVRPALGPQVVLVVPAGSGEAVVLTKPEDEAKLRALVERGGDRAVLSERDGWTVAAETQTSLDAYERALEDGTLADDDAFRAALERLPADALLRLWVDGSGLGAALARGAGTAGAAIPGGAGLAGPLAGSADALGRVAAAVVAEEDGLRLVADATPEDAPPPAYEPELLGRVPADALLAISFRGGEAVRSQLEGLGGGEELERAIGLPLDELAGLLEGEGVLYLRPGAPIPEVTLALAGAGERGTAVVGRLVESLGGLVPGAAGGGLRPVTETEDGVRVSRLELGQGIALRWASVDGDLVLTTGAGGIRSLRGGGAKLTGTEAFERAAADVGYEGETGGLAYVDVDGLVPLLEGLAGLSGGGGGEGFGEVAAALEAIETAAVHARPDGSRLRLEGFLRVR